MKKIKLIIIIVVIMLFCTSCMIRRSYNSYLSGKDTKLDSNTYLSFFYLNDYRTINSYNILCTVKNSNNKIVINDKINLNKGFNVFRYELKPGNYKISFYIIKKDETDFFYEEEVYIYKGFENYLSYGINIFSKKENYFTFSKNIDDLYNYIDSYFARNHSSKYYKYFGKVFSSNNFFYSKGYIVRKKIKFNYDKNIVKSITFSYDNDFNINKTDDIYFDEEHSDLLEICAGSESNIPIQYLFKVQLTDKYIKKYDIKTDYLLFLVNAYGSKLSRDNTNEYVIDLNEIFTENRIYNLLNNEWNNTYDNSINIAYLDDILINISLLVREVK